MREPTDDELWRGVEETLVKVIHPAVADGWARAATAQLVGLVRYARARVDVAGTRATEVRNALAALAGNPHLVPGDDPLTVASEALASAVDDDGPAGDAVRSVLRPVITGHLDEDVQRFMPMLATFGGTLGG